MKEYEFKYSSNYWGKIFSVPIATLIGISISLFAILSIISFFELQPIYEVSETWYTVLVLGSGLLIMVAPFYFLVFYVVPMLVDRKGAAQIHNSSVIINLGEKSHLFGFDEIKAVSMGTPDGVLGLLLWLLFRLFRLYFIRLAIKTNSGKSLKIAAPMKDVTTLRVFYEALSTKIATLHQT